MSYRLNAAKQNRDDFHLALLSCCWWTDTGWQPIICLWCELAVIRDQKQNIDNIRLLRLQNLALVRSSWCESYDGTPSEVVVLEFDLDQTASLQKLEAVVRVHDDVAHIFGMAVKLLAQIVVILDSCFVCDDGACLLVLELSQLLL